MAKSQKPKSNHTVAKVILILIILLLIAGTGLMVRMCIDIAAAPVGSGSQNDGFLNSIFDLLKQSDVIPGSSGTAAPQPTVPAAATAPTEETEPETAPPETTLPAPEHVVSTATIISTGDVLMHMPIVSAGWQQDGTYNFDNIFQYVSEYASAADYAVANLETTLAGTDNGYKYSGYPNFNCPDEITDALAGAGFDMLLTGNNHSYDTSMVGYKRTQEVIHDRGLANLGSTMSGEDPKYAITEINDIHVGMLCYTYATSVTSDGRPALNGLAAMSEAGVCNYFTYENLPAFYDEVETYLAEMKEAGAEATVLYIHWGLEYQTSPNFQQIDIAQKLCDLGVDVIIGGHPHVVQPMDLLTSTVDPEHKTVILYSMGNAVSNQRLGNIQSISTAHTEDGVLFSITFSKYSDGTVYLENVDLIPCWVNLKSNAARQYIILPLDDSTREEWKEKYNLNDTEFAAAENSYSRTMKLVRDGLKASQEYLSQEKEQREADYEAAVLALVS